MKKTVIGAVVIGVFFVWFSLISGEVTDKRAVGEPGEKVFQLHVDSTLLDRWVTVTEQEWDDCFLYEDYPACAG